MSSFSAPVWDVDKSADILFNKFSGNRKHSSSKNVSKKKHQEKFGVRSEGVKEKFNNGNPRPSTHGRRQKEGKINLQGHKKTKNKNFNEKIVASKGKKFRGSEGVTFETRNQGTSKFAGKKQKSFRNDSNRSNIKNFKTSNISNKEPCSDNLKKKKNLSHGKSFEVNMPANKRLNTKTIKQRFKNSGKNKNVELENHGRDYSVGLKNKNQNNRKRRISQVIESQDHAKNFKKRKIDYASDQQKQFQKQALKDKRLLSKNSFKEDSGNLVKGNSKTISSSQPNKTENNGKTKNKMKKLKKSTNFENLKSSKSLKLNSDVKEANGKGNQSPLVFKNPYSRKNQFLDSSLSLRERMLQQLKSSRFRYINEQLYTSDSKDAENMFKGDPYLFQIYHEGFKQQVEQWPLNPVDRIIKAIQNKPSNLVVADFGCGDAKIAKSVPNKVHSFDLVALSNEVTVCDMAHTPLENESVDISVFCLSLMGTNLGNYLAEANRILKVRGILKIAEVASRFDSVEKFIIDVKKYEFSLINKDLSHDLFYFLNFRKDSNVKKVKGLPNLSLNPCWYKKR